MNDARVNAMVAELHSAINMQLQRLITMAADIAELREEVKAKDAEIEELKNGSAG